MSEDRAGEALSSKSSRIVRAHTLLRGSKRRQAGEFLADGAQSVREAVAAHRRSAATVHELYVTAAGVERYREVVRAAAAAEIPVTEVTDRAAQRLSDSVTPQGVTARCALPSPPSLDVLIAASPHLLAVLVEPSNPGNAGTVIRLADAAGAAAVIVAGDAVDPWGPKAVRGSAGSIFHLPVVREHDPLAVVAALRGAGFLVLATTGGADLTLPAATAQGLLGGPTAWLFGNEAHGLSEEVIAAATPLQVPIYGQAESLNLATAAAICLYASADVHHRRDDAAQR